jgi:hypothetical protein
MARDTITAQELPGYGEALASDLTYTSLVAANDAQWVNTGKELLFVRNDDAGSQTITVAGVASSTNFNQAKDIATAVAASSYQVIGPFNTSCFHQGGGYAYINVSTDNWKVAVVKLPTT